MITTPEIICDIFDFLDKDQIERVQLVNKFWNNVIIRHKNILPLRQFFLFFVKLISFSSNRIRLYETKEDFDRDFCRDYADLDHYIINFDGTNLSKIEENVSSRYSQLTVDEVLTNLNDVVFDTIRCDSEDGLDNLLNLMKLVTRKTGSRFRGRYATCCAYRFDSKMNEIVDNYIIVDELTLTYPYSSHRGVSVYKWSSTIVQLPSTPKEIRLKITEMKDIENLLDFTCNGKSNEANRLTIRYKPRDTNKLTYQFFVRKWFELYRTHENLISLVGKFEIDYCPDMFLDAVKKILKNNQLRVKYSLETKEFESSSSASAFENPKPISGAYLKRRCVLHETDSYALVIEMEYRKVTDISSINASDLNQPPYYKMKKISFCVKSL